MSFSASTYPKAQKGYRCADCYREISAGQQHLKAVMKADVTNNKVCQLRYCERCAQKWGWWRKAAA